jgi:hypothetical protein
MAEAQLHIYEVSYGWKEIHSVNFKIAAHSLEDARATVEQKLYGGLLTTDGYDSFVEKDPQNSGEITDVTIDKVYPTNEELLTVDNAEDI